MKAFASIILAAVLGAHTIVAGPFSTRRAAHNARESEICTVGNQTWATCCVEGGPIGWPETIYNCMAPSQDITTIESLVEACGEHWMPQCCTPPVEGQLAWVADSQCNDKFLEN